MSSSFNIGCTLCGKISILAIEKERGYSPMDYYLCKEHWLIFKAERGVKEKMEELLIS